MKFLRFFTKHLPLTTVAMLMAACASEDYVGNRELHEANENGRPVSFGLVAAPQTRAVYGGEAAGLLNNNFVVWGEKKVGEETQTVFDNYQLDYVTNSASTTTSNSAGWEYVGYKNLPYGTTTASGVALNNNGVADNATASGVDQTIKYWDYGASKYNFFAYSLGMGDDTEDPASTKYAKASHMTSSGLSNYTLSGTADQLKACYITDKETVIPSGSSSGLVRLKFMSFTSNVRLAFYETVPGYSVNNVQFYPDAGTTTEAGVIPYLYASSNSLPPTGENNVSYTVSFDDPSGKAQVSSPTSETLASNLAFGDALTYTAEKEYMEPQEEGTTPYIGRTSDTATPTTTVTVLPNPQNNQALTLKVDYNLVSRDYGEKIKVTGATATVPAIYARWQPNYTYTYLFKITDFDLSPITLDAMVITSAEGTQETITTVNLSTEPSITTYQYGSYYATADEYKEDADHPIYIVVDNGTALTVTGSGINAKLYTVTLQGGATQTVTEAVVADILKNVTESAGTWTVTGQMTVTLVTSDATDKLVQITEIPAADAPHGTAITINGAKFAPQAGKIYVFEYTDLSDNKYYKVIKVGL